MPAMRSPTRSPGMPAVIEGRDALGALFGGFGAAATSIEVQDVTFHQTDDPRVAIVQERMVAELHGGGRYENLLIIVVTFRDGLIAEMFEYYGAACALKPAAAIGFCRIGRDPSLRTPPTPSRGAISMIDQTRNNHICALRARTDRRPDDDRCAHQFPTGTRAQSASGPRGAGRRSPARRDGRRPRGTLPVAVTSSPQHRGRPAVGEVA